MRVLITGGSGFIGSNLIELLLTMGVTDLVNIDIVAPENLTHKKYWLCCDVCDNESIKRFFLDNCPEFVIHLAGRTDLNGSDIDSYQTNVDGTKSVIEGANSCQTVRRVIFASTILVNDLGVVPQDVADCAPATMYGLSKSHAEKLIRQIHRSSWEWVIVRPTSIWGPGFKAPYINFFETIQKGYFFYPRGVCVRRSYGYVGNIVYQLMKIMTAKSCDVSKKTFYLADFYDTEIYEWALAIKQEFGSGGVFAIPKTLFGLMGVIGDLLSKCGFKNPPLTTVRVKNMMTGAVYPTSDLRGICGQLPYDMTQSIRLTVEWMKEYRARNSERERV